MSAAGNGRSRSEELSEVMGAVWRAAMPLAERRRLALRLSFAALRVGGHDAGDGDRDGLHAAPEGRGEGDGTQLRHLEEILLSVGQLEGRTPGDRLPSISEAKRVLRDRGQAGARMASRLGKLSKSRNAVAHPDVAMAMDVASLATTSGEDVPVVPVAPTRLPITPKLPGPVLLGAPPPKQQQPQQQQQKQQLQLQQQHNCDELCGPAIIKITIF